MDTRIEPPNAPQPLSAERLAWIAVDVGNTRIKLGAFDSQDGAPLPEPYATLVTVSRDGELAEIDAWLAGLGASRTSWWIGSVNRAATTRLIDHLRLSRGDDRVTLLAAGDLPLAVALERPDMVGVDRLLDALAANALRIAGRAAVVVDVGSAITVDLLSAEGAFQGGAILPGLGMAARALHEFTDMLPLLEMAELTEPPPAVGTATLPAMQSGLFWGAVGAIRELVDRMTSGQAHAAEVYITGGAGPAVADLLGPAARFIPHLTLSGIALATRHAARHAINGLVPVD